MSLTIQSTGLVARDFCVGITNTPQTDTPMIPITHQTEPPRTMQQIPSRTAEHCRLRVLALASGAQCGPHLASDLSGSHRPLGSKNANQEVEAIPRSARQASPPTLGIVGLLVRFVAPRLNRRVVLGADRAGG